MKKLAILLTAIVWVGMTLPMTAQKHPTKHLTTKYGSADGFTLVNINKDLFTLLAEMSRENEDTEMGQASDVIKDLDNISILMYNLRPGNDTETLELFREELNSLKINNFSELMSVKEQENLVRFLIRKEGDKIKELLMIINQPTQAGFVSISGDIDLKSISRIARSMNVMGLENLEKINQE